MSSTAEQPRVVVVAGPNGAGKSTSASVLLPEVLSVLHFVNADTIAAGLSAFAPETVAIEAGRVMLARIKELAARHADFAFETTLSSRSFAPFLRDLQQQGYLVFILHVWLRRPELAVQRVAARVARGGHSVPPPVVMRRYWRSHANFRRLYRPLADDWILCDNSGEVPVVVAHGHRDVVAQVLDQDLYDEFERAQESTR